MRTSTSIALSGKGANHPDWGKGMLVWNDDEKINFYNRDVQMSNRKGVSYFPVNCCPGYVRARHFELTEAPTLRVIRMPEAMQKPLVKGEVVHA